MITSKMTLLIAWYKNSTEEVIGILIVENHIAVSIKIIINVEYLHAFFGNYDVLLDYIFKEIIQKWK